MIIYQDNIKSQLCELIIDKFDLLNEQKIISQRTNDDIRIFGFEKVLEFNKFLPLYNLSLK